MTHSRVYKSQQPLNADLPAAVRAMRRAGQLQQEVEEELSTFDLNWAQFDTLLALRKHEPVCVRGAIRQTGEGAPRRIEKLEDKGYVEKRLDPDDWRRKEITLTDEGNEALSQAILKLEHIQITPDPKEQVELEED